MEHAVISVDLISMILSYADKGTLALCTRVSRDWFEPAIRNLWTSIDNILCLVSLLPKKRYDNEGGLFSYEADTDSDWERFTTYGKLVRSLVLNCTDEEVIHNTLSTLAYTRPVAALLPNLVDLTIHSGPSVLDSLFFFHEGLKNVVIHNIDYFSIQTLLKHVLRRLLSVRSLQLLFTCEENAAEYDERFIRVFQDMMQLEELSISEFEITQNMMSCLASLPKLRKLSCDVSEYESEDDDDDESAAEFELDEDMVFRKATLQSSNLQVLSLEATAEMISHFLFLDHDFSKMKELSVEFIDLASEVVLRKNCENLASRWFSLTHLRFQIQEELMDLEDTNTLLLYDTFRSLSNLHQLRYFDFYYDTPLVIDNNELEGLLTNWPLLEHFIIRSSPDYAYQEEATLTLHSIELFATNCKNLKELRIHLNATQVDGVESQCNAVPATMENLETVAFSFSPIEDDEAVAVYLSQFLPLSCEMVLEEKVETGDSTDEVDEDDKKRMETMEEYLEKWKSASKTLQTILKIMERERKIHALRLKNSLRFDAF